MIRLRGLVVGLLATAALVLGLVIAGHWYLHAERVPEDAVQVSGVVVGERQGLMAESANIVEVQYSLGDRQRTARFPVSGTNGGGDDLVYYPGDEVRLVVAPSRPRWASLLTNGQTELTDEPRELGDLLRGGGIALTVVAALLLYRYQSKREGGIRIPW